MRETIKDLYGNDDVEAMYAAALAVPLTEKIEMAIDLIRCFEKQALALSDDGYYVCFSGGKDSIVMERLFAMSGVKYKSYYNNTTIDPPELVQFIKREYPHTIWNNPKKHLLTELVNRAGGAPTRRVRWCCEVYKEQGGAGTFRAIGVRAAESARRKGLWKLVRQDDYFKTPMMSPVLYWTDEDVWAFIGEQHMKYCSLYDEGFKRLGCVGCPLGGRKRAAEFKRWPKYEKMWQRSFQKYWERWKTVPKKDGNERWSSFKTWEDYWQWWMEEENVNDTDQPDCQMFLW